MAVENFNFESTDGQGLEKSLDSRLVGGIGFYAASIGTDVGRRLPVGGAPGGSSVEGDSEGSAA